MFATDRDLLVLEPALFARVAWVGQRLVSGVGSLVSGTLTMTSQDVGFDAAGVDAGHVAIVGGVPYEVLGRTSALVLELSRLRAGEADAAIVPADAADVSVSVATFGPQIADVHRRLLSMLGLEASGATGDGVVTEDALTNAADFVRLEAFGALHLVFAGASATADLSSAEWQRSAWYRARFDEERRRVVGRVDLDGDGKADAVRRLNAMRFVRA